MDHYIVAKSMTLSVHGKKYNKNDVVSSADIGIDNIPRFVQKGYIKPANLISVNPEPSNTENDVTGGGCDDILAPEQVNRLSKTQLINYAESIGLHGLKANLNISILRDEVNRFIEREFDDDETPDGSEEDEA